MENKGIVKIEGIKCDHCTYENKKIQISEFQFWVGKPCPRCDHTLLTENDLNIVKLLMATTGIANGLSTDQSSIPEEVNKMYTPASNSTSD